MDDAGAEEGGGDTLTGLLGLSDHEDDQPLLGVDEAQGAPNRTESRTTPRTTPPASDPAPCP